MSGDPKNGSGSEAANQRVRLNNQLSNVDRKLEGVLKAIEDGAWNAALKQRLDDLELQQRELRQQINTLEQTPSVVTLHPNAAAIYAAQVEQLRTNLNDPAIRDEVIATLRSLIEQIVLTPDDNAQHGMAIELSGDLATILSLSAGIIDLPGKSGIRANKNPRISTGVLSGTLSLVAGPRNSLDLLLNTRS